MQRIEQKVHRAVSAQLQSVGLTDAQFYVLAHVRFAEGQIQQEVADARLVTQANICQMVTKLEADGLLVRHREGRSNRLFLTERGRTLIDSILPGHERLLAAHFAELPLESQQLLHQLPAILTTRWIAQRQTSSGLAAGLLSERLSKSVFATTGG